MKLVILLEISPKHLNVKAALYSIICFLGIGSGEASIEQCIKLASRPSNAQKWKRCKTLIIDEISMIDASFFDKLEHVRLLQTCFIGVKNMIKFGKRGTEQRFRLKSIKLPERYYPIV